MMDHLLPGVDALVDLEHKTIVEKWGEGYNSHHEAYAVLKEEIEEAHEKLETIKRWHDRLWSCIREDMGNLEDKISRIEHNAKQLAAEAVQVAAVCRRAKGGTQNDA